MTKSVRYMLCNSKNSPNCRETATFLSRNINRPYVKVSCINCNSTRKKSKKTILNQEKINNSSNLNIASNKNKYTRQFLIKFHPFTFKLPGLSESNQKSILATSKHINYKSGSMSQRCCLSVSVVPSDKHNGNKKPSSKKM